MRIPSGNWSHNAQSTKMTVWDISVCDQFNSITLFIDFLEMMAKCAHWQKNLSGSFWSVIRDNLINWQSFHKLFRWAFLIWTLRVLRWLEDLIYALPKMIAISHFTKLPFWLILFFFQWMNWQPKVFACDVIINDGEICQFSWNR